MDKKIILPNKTEKSKELKKFPWENERQLAFRVDMSKLSRKMKDLLAALDSQQPKYNELKEKVKSLQNEVKKMIVPEIYEKQYEYYCKSIEFHLKAFNLLDDTLLSKGVVREGKKPDSIFRAAKYIEAGTAYTKIIMVMNFDLFDRMNEEYLLKKESEVKNAGD